MKLEDIALKFNMQVNPNQERVNIVLNKLDIIQKETGIRYCPCMPNRTKDTICPCKIMREKQVCRCGLYIPNN